jgi:predicted phage terminase large subunit-like protein
MTKAIKPQPGPQTKFLATPADIAIYGGAAGGGKTWALLMEPLRHIDNPDFGAVIFRQTYGQIMEEGGVWEDSARIYPYTGGEARVGKALWAFPSGARVRFRYMQHEKDKYTYQGAQIPLLCFDQLEQFSAGQFFYLLSRNRSTCGVRPYVRATCNPDPDCFLAEFLDWWIGDDGYARADRAGKLRYFARIGERIAWADSPGDLVAQYPSFFEEVGQPPETLIKSVTFIPASVYDNEILLRENPEYLANLLALPPVDRERLLRGNWKIREAAGLLFNRAWFEIVDAVPAGGREVRFWDFAATVRSMSARDPDYTAGVGMRDVSGVYYVTDCVAVRQGPAEVDRLVLNLAKQDRHTVGATGASYAVRWELEPGASGKRDAARLVRMLAGFDARPVKPQGDKVVRAKPLAAQAVAGNVKLIRGKWVEQWLQHMHHQPDWSHDDIMDASSGAFNALIHRVRGRGPIR